MFPLIFGYHFVLFHVECFALSSFRHHPFFHIFLVVSCPEIFFGSQTTGIPGLSDIDITFALSATSANSNATYTFMQNTLKTFIDKYGANQIQYSIIVYGDRVERVVTFNSSFPPTDNQLKSAIDAQSALTGGPVLEDALQETFKIFNESKGRPAAKKALVVVTDNNSGTDKGKLSAAVKTVEEQKVLVISVAVGGVVDTNELAIISPNPLDVISTNVNEIPEKVGDRVIDRILRRKELFCLLSTEHNW